MSGETEEMSDLQSGQDYDAVIWSDDPEREYFKSIMKSGKSGSGTPLAYEDSLIGDGAAMTNILEESSLPTYDQPIVRLQGDTGLDYLENDTIDNIEPETPVNHKGGWNFFYPAKKQPEKEQGEVDANPSQPFSPVSALTPPNVGDDHVDVVKIHQDLDYIEGGEIPGFIFVASGRTAAVTTKNPNAADAGGAVVDKGMNGKSNNGKAFSDTEAVRSEGRKSCSFVKWFIVGMVIAVLASVVLIVLVITQKGFGSSASSNLLPNAPDVPTSAPVPASHTSPSHTPLSNLTAAPSESVLHNTTKPTRKPVSPPSAAPIQPLTRAPVAHVTKVPVPAPTIAPFPAPTLIPVPPPTLAPIPPPTLAPIFPPTLAPIPAPTQAPVPAPTQSPVPPPTQPPVPLVTLSPISPPTAVPVPASTPVPVIPQTPMPVPSPTVKPTASPMEILRNFLVSQSPASASALSTSGTPQYQALQWLASEPNVGSYSSAKKVQRWVLATLYHSTAGSQWTSSTSWLSQINECSWYQVACDNTQTFVESLTLGSNNMVGSLPLEITLLSNSLSILSLNANAITGTLATQLGFLSQLRKWIV